ncbi:MULTISPECIES: serpin family protein [unclassified Crossiella]|uniref:serpin family protein n=1 Tax=unclassified Crossiella TaxID=2620835 RepID=UPI001FFEC116|nr:MULTISPECIES: serpin family protein [unclassified Crossiella]MCK2239441.1 serpin family protein [Crossiella sp. S99.2]MCK2252136.1 serpin family protein [Crossiella sp. S99.1]
MLPFTLDLHRALPRPTEPNPCWSPYSVAAALSLLLDAATGTAHEELRQVLGDPRDLLAQAAEVGSGPTLAVSSTVWADTGVPIRDEYRAAVGAQHVRAVALRSQPEQARGVINADVAETTRGLIPEAVPPGMIGPDTLVVLVNALYLRAAWRTAFTAVGELPFRAPAAEVPVPMMRVRARLGYLERDGWRVVVVPAAGGVEVVVAVPDGEIGDLAGVPWEVGDSRVVELVLPRFRAAARVRLEQALRGVGIREVFGAGLAGLTSAGASVSAVLHQAVLSVDEQGLEGAAVTVIATRGRRVPVEPEVSVLVDRPFAVLVRHADTRVPYFVATVTDPAAG